MFDTACIMIIKQKNNYMKMKKRGEDLEVWSTHCLVHRSPGAPIKDYLAHPIVSEEEITYIQQHSRDTGNEKSQDIDFV